MQTTEGCWRQRFEAPSEGPSEGREPGGAVSPADLCDWLQEAAGGHARALGASIDRLLEEGRTWVLARLDLRIGRLPGRGEEVWVETWPSGSKGISAWRDFLVRVDGEVVARATTAWFVIDLQRRRPVRLPPQVREIEPVRRPPALPRGVTRLPPLDRADHRRRYEAATADLDVNGHVNHVRLLAWGCETLPPDFRSGHRLASLEIDFRAEVRAGARVVGEAQRVEGEGEGEEVVLHRLALAGDGSEAARMRTSWVAVPAAPAAL